MCGIAGFTGEGSSTLIHDMTQAIAHRGPDDEGFLDDGAIRLGMRRLAIVDVETGRQPVHNEDESVWTVFNGEIYNHRELREELKSKGHRFYTDHSDTEVIVHLYEEFGEDFVRKINGMFAIAVWDRSARKLLLYRDRVGKKPLYYSLASSRLSFASEIKSLLKLPWISRELNPSAISGYFSQKHISAPQTAFRDIRQILPGHYAVFQDGGILEKAYWAIDFSKPLEISEDEAKAEIISLLEDAVIRRMDCDVPFGAYLSGGIDSSLVVTLMRRHLNRPVKTFSLGYEDAFENKDQDLQYARRLSRRLGTEHHEYIMKASEIPGALSKIMEAFDEPFSGTVSTYFLSILIKQHVKVALSGDGADELFGSYLAHRLAFPIEHFTRLSPEKQKDFSLLTVRDRERIKPFDSPDQFQFLAQIADLSESIWRSRLNVFLDDEKKKLLLNGFADASSGNLSSRCFTACDAMNRTLEIDQQDLLPNQVLPFVDRLSMAHSIEVRVPFLDYRLVEFVAELPGSMKIKDGVTKYILKKVAEDFLPPDLVHRPKEGFVLPVYSWMRRDLQNFVLETLSVDNVKRIGFLNAPYVETLVKEFFEGAKTEAKIWNLVCFTIWWEKYFG